LCQLLSLSGQRVAFENPGYDGVRTVFANLGCSLSPVTLEEDGINIGELENTGANLVYVTPAHQFPLGMVLSIQKRKKLLQWAESGERFIIEDDYDSEFRYSSQPIPPLKAMDYDDKVIYLGTFSKAFMPGARLSYIILPQQLSSLFKTKLANYNQSSPPLIQNGLELFMKQGDFERHIRKMRKVYQQKHRMLTASINLYMGNRIEMIGQKAGLHLLINVDNRDFMDLKERGLQQEVLIHSPEKFWINRGDCPKSLVMLGFGGLTEMEIREGIERLGKAWF
ncbi:aminotransferase-like domain-containing protein, partial [Bacillus canaveralius]